MPRLKKRVLFNKNHVIIIEEELDRSAFDLQDKYFGYRYGDVNKTEPNKILNIGKNKVVRKESPLGFYYYSRVFPEEHTILPMLKTYSIELICGNTLYGITYPISYNNNSIGTDLRPWQISPTDKSIHDHFVMDLYKLLDDILHKFDKTGGDLPYIYRRYSENTYMDKSIGDIKVILYTDLFGNPKGPRYQTNEEKIVSHGFDLKTSFRKM